MRGEIEKEDRLTINLSVLVPFFLVWTLAGVEFSLPVFLPQAGMSGRTVFFRFFFFSQGSIMRYPMDSVVSSSFSFFLYSSLFLLSRMWLPFVLSRRLSFSLLICLG